MAHATDERQLVLLELLARSAAIAEPPPGHLDLDLLDRDLEACGQAFEDDDERLAMVFGRRDADKDGFLSKAEFTTPMQRPAQ